jgi:hypothetical protein
MNTALEYSTRVVQEGGRRCKKSTLNDLVHLTPLRIPLMNPPFVMPPGPSPVKNPRKLKVKQHTNYPRSEDVTTAIEKNPGKDPPAIMFFCSGRTLIQSGSILSC